MSPRRLAVIVTLLTTGVLLDSPVQAQQSLSLNLGYFAVPRRSHPNPGRRPDREPQPVRL